MNVASIPKRPGAFHRRKRVGRGIGSGHGKTSTRGQKGQRARTGSRKHPGFEGGQNPLIRRLPKRGFRRKATGQAPRHDIVNVRQLNRFADGTPVTPELLAQEGIVRATARPIKLLGMGDVTKKLVIKLHGASEEARAKVTKAGGTLELLR